MGPARVAIVTGGASGVGLSICQHLARQGHQVAVLDADNDAAKRAADDLPAGAGVAFAAQVDVSDRAAVDESFGSVRAALGPIAILVTSAAVSGFVPFERISADDWDRTMRVNLTGTFHCIQAAIPDMVVAGWGRIVTISSAAGQTGSVRQGHYSASKGGVIALTKTLALELGPRGITVNTIPPGAIDTPMSRRAASEGRFGGGTLDDVGRHLPVRRIGVPDDIAAACAYLVSDEASYVTGQIIGVNGGRVV
jgi:2-hydroxycyclohexanecarboxyl-CoA dehydrogenase